jgi:uncharacterized protein YutD
MIKWYNIFFIYVVYFNVGVQSHFVALDSLSIYISNLVSYCNFGYTYIHLLRFKKSDVHERITGESIY